MYLKNIEFWINWPFLIPELIRIIDQNFPITYLKMKIETSP